MTDQTDAMRVLMLLVAVFLAASGCAADPEIGRSVGSPLGDSMVDGTATGAEVSEGQAPSSTLSEVEPPISTLPSDVAFNGRPVPLVATNPEDAAAIFATTHAAMEADDAELTDYANQGHTQQLVIRQLMRNPDWIEPFRALLSDDLREIADLHITARRELGLLHDGSTPPIENIPAWAIIDPEPLDELVGHYTRAGEATGIDWRLLAAINLIETGMGRIDGLSSAGAQGPMQFLPSTWDEVGNGGDINDPGDAIDGAARYLVQRGGLDDIRQGLFGYNNSDHYVNAVLAYAELMERDESALRGFYNWEVYVGTSEGTLWLPVGYLSPEPTPATEYVKDNPWAVTLG